MRRVDRHLDEEEVLPRESAETCSVGDFVSFATKAFGVVDGVLRQKTTRGWAYVDSGTPDFPTVWRVPTAALNLIAREVA